MKPKMKWKPAKIIYPNDHIVSSKARDLGDLGFQPQFYNDRYKMSYIMGNEYMRLWFKERAFYEKENLTKQEKGFVDQSLKRRYVQRMMTINPSKKSRELQREKPKPETAKKEKVVVKTDAGDVEACEKYPKAIEPVNLKPFKPDCRKIEKKNGISDLKFP